jgi:DNA-binding response OmpR family regulator
MKNCHINHSLKPGSFSLLVVDDDESNRNLLVRRLQNEGYTTAEAADGLEAIELLAIERFDIILLDLNMPRMGGFEFLEWLNEHNSRHGMHIITLSGESNRDTVVTALTLGANDYIIKSASVIELISRIRRVCLTRYLQNKNKVILETSALKGSSVLAVDDDELNRKLVCRHLDKAGFSARCFANGKELLDAIKKDPVDLLLLDIQMPDLDGIELLEAIRKDFHAEQLAIIMLTAVDDTEKTDQCYQLGADDYILKPFSGTELISRISAALELKILRNQNKKLDELSKLGSHLRSN